MLTKAPQAKTIDTALNCDTCSHIAPTIEPVLKQVVALSGQVV
jgi:hypothetical protein